MFRRSRLFSVLLLILLVLIVLIPVTGCVGPTENLADRPWNAPQSWEGSAIPGAVFQGR